MRVSIPNKKPDAVIHTLASTSPSPPSPPSFTMPTEHVSNPRDFDHITRNSGNLLIVVDFHASWCGPCHAIAPFYEQLSTRYARRARFLKVDVDNDGGISAQAGVSSMPTFQFYVRGRQVAQVIGGDRAGLEENCERFAPTSAQISFGGAGQTLGSAAGGPPKVDWGSAPKASKGKGAGDRREEMAKAAAARAKDTSKTKDDDGPKVDEALLKQMEEMGFPKVRAQKGLMHTGNKSLEPAMEWCFEHSDDADIDKPLPPAKSDSASKPAPATGEKEKATDAKTPSAELAPPVKETPSPAVSAGKIQLRLQDGSRLEKTFEPHQMLGDVAAFVVSSRPELAGKPLGFSSTYPRRKFTAEDQTESLESLGLLPRGALNVSF